MKRVKRFTSRMLAVMLAGALAAGNWAVPAFGADDSEGFWEAADSSEMAAGEVSAEKTDAAAEVMDDAETVTSCTVTLDANGGCFVNEWDDVLGEYVERTEILHKEISAGGTVDAIPVKEQDGAAAVFQGWSPAQDGEILLDKNEPYTPEAGVLFYACWQEPEPDTSAEETEKQQEFPEDSAEDPGFPEETANHGKTEEGSAGTAEPAEESGEEAEPADESGEKADLPEEPGEKAEPAEESEEEAGSAEEPGDNAQEELLEDSADQAEDAEEPVTQPAGQAESDKDSLPVSEKEAEEAAKGEGSREPGLEEEPLAEELAGVDPALDASGSTDKTCGENLTWTLSDKGILTVSGTGAMTDYYGYGTSTRAPWYESRDKIKAVRIEEGVTHLGNYAWFSCGNISQITLPGSLQSIGDEAFYRASGPAVLQLPEGLTSIQWCAFEEMSGIQEVRIPDSVTSMEYGAFEGCPDLKKVTVGSGILRLPNSTFAGASSLKTVVLPDSLQWMGNSVFANCTSLAQIDLPDSVAEIGEKAFSGCTSLSRLELPEKLRGIPAQAFRDCTSLPQIVIPDAVTEIGKQAFYDCFSLTRAVLPASLVTLEDEAFYGCSLLQTIVLRGQDFDVGENVFFGCPDTMKVVDADGNLIRDPQMGEVTPAVSGNQDRQNYTVWNTPRRSYLVEEENGRCLRVEWTGSELTREYYDKDGLFLSRSTIPFELDLFGGFYAGQDAYYLVFGQDNYEEDDKKEVIRIVRYTRDWVRQDAASICGENTTSPFNAGTVSLTEEGGMLYLRTAHQMYQSDDGLRHQANLTAAVRESDMAVTWCFSDISNSYYGYVSHSFNQIIRTDGTDILAADHGDAYPRGIVLFRYSGKAGSGTLGVPDNVVVLPIAGTIGNNATGASLGALEASSSHYLIAGNSVSQEEDNYNPGGVRNIFVTATKKDNFSSSGTTLRWITSFTGSEIVTTPVMTALPDGRFLLMWTADKTLQYCFLRADGAPEGKIYESSASLSDCAPYVKGNAVWWYVTKSTAPIYYYISLDAPEEVKVQNPGHTLVLDAAGGSLKTGQIEVTHGEKYGDLPTPEREPGYEFLGWYTGKKGGSKITADTLVRVRSTETFYAHWKQHWSFSETDGTLTVLDEGEMKDYSAEWESVKSRVKRVVLAEGATNVRYWAFSDYPVLEQVVLPDTVTSIEYSAFRDCASLKEVVFPDSRLSIGEYAFSGCTSLEKADLPEELVKLSYGAFDQCESLKKIRIPGTVEKLESYVFSDCTGLEEAVLGEGIGTLPSSFFYGCTSLSSVSLPSTLTEIGSSAFYNCETMTDIDLPSGLLSIGNRAFSNCFSLEDLIVGKNLQQIGQSAFFGCYALENVFYEGKEEAWQAVAIGTSNDSYLGRASFHYETRGHRLTFRKAVEPACEETGTIAHYLCRDCGKAYLDEEGTQKVSIDQLTVAPRGHTAVKDAAVAATCTKTGLTEGSHCSVCGTVLQKQETVPMTAHTWDKGKVTKEPSCTEKGIRTITCTKCGATKTQAVAATGHSFGEWSILLPATVQEEGLQERKCTRCGQVEQKAIPKLEPVDVFSISMEKTSADVATTKTLQLKVLFTPDNATDQSLTWSSDDPAVATVDQNGLVKAHKYGKATITAKTSNGRTADCEIQTRFIDVNNAGKSYYTPVYWAVDKGITVCTVTFRPDDSVTRGEFVAFLWRLAGKPKSGAKVNFKDVTSSTKFYDAIRWAVGQGIIKGYSDGTFKSDNPVTRGETATMIWRYAGKKTPKTTASPFSDIKPSSADSYKAILWGSENGIIKGSSGKFLKNEGCTRGQVVTFLYRYKLKY